MRILILALLLFGCNDVSRQQTIARIEKSKVPVTAIIISVEEPTIYGMGFGEGWKTHFKDSLGHYHSKSGKWGSVGDTLTDLVCWPSRYGPRLEMHGK